MLFLATNR